MELPRSQPMNIVLIGFMGTGKSAVGRALARRLEARLVDTDAEVERLIGKSIPEIFAENGEELFRRAETQVLRGLTAGSQTMIVSTGGGTPLREENAQLLRQIGVLVLLITPVETILRRVGRNLAQRPLLAGYTDDPEARVRALLAQRAPRYSALADLQISTAAYDGPDAVATRIITKLGS